MPSTDSIADHLFNIDIDTYTVRAAITRDVEADIDLSRVTNNEVGPVAVDFNLGTRLVVEPGGCVEDEVVRFLSSLASNLGYELRKVVK